MSVSPGDPEATRRLTALGYQRIGLAIGRADEDGYDLRQYSIPQSLAGKAGDIASRLKKNTPGRSPTRT